MVKNISTAIKKYGCDVSIKRGNDSQSGKAFLQPLRYKNNMYLNGVRLGQGYFDGGHYLFIGEPHINLSDYVNTVIYCNNEGYIIKRAEQYIYRNKTLYVWAILTPYARPLEDDYDDN